MENTDQVIFQVKDGQLGNVGVIELNRPKALNALSHEMINALYDQLRQWAEDDTIKAVFISGRGRAFCAGGDIRFFYDNGRDGCEKSMNFFRDEYRLNQHIFHYPKPYISLLDGITMGGGAGISIHGSHRIATDRTRFAMPETTIGFYPDIGARYFLNQLPQYFGMYMGLTATHIDAKNTVALGLATQWIDDTKIPDLLEIIAATAFTQQDHQQLDTALQSISRPTPNWQLPKEIPEQLYMSAFAKDNLFALLNTLQQSDDPWAQQTLASCLEKCPISLDITFNELRKAQDQSFDEVILGDRDITQQFVSGSDFYEGIRAAVVDKDRNPRWSTSSLLARNS